MSGRRRELKCSECTRLCSGINWSRHDLRRQLPAQHVLEAEQLLGRVMGPVDRVEDVHLLRHLPQLGHGVTSQRVNVGVDLGTECGQEVIAVHHLGAASLGLSLQRPGLGEGDCSQGRPGSRVLSQRHFWCSACTHSRSCKSALGPGLSSLPGLGSPAQPGDLHYWPLSPGSWWRGLRPTARNPSSV